MDDHLAFPCCVLTHIALFTNAHTRGGGRGHITLYTAASLYPPPSEDGDGGLSLAYLRADAHYTDTFTELHRCNKCQHPHHEIHRSARHAVAVAKKVDKCPNRVANDA